MKRSVLRAGVAIGLATATWAQGVIGTFAGTEFLFPADRILALSAPLGGVQDVALDAAGNLYISDRDNHIVVQAAPDGTLMVVAGNGLAGFSGDQGNAVNASLRTPLGLAIDASGNLYIADSADNRVRKVTPDGIITTFAGTGVAGFSGDGPALGNQLNQPRGLAVDIAGNLYIADSVNNRIRKITPAGFMTTFAGTGSASNSGDRGPAIQAGLNTPAAVKVDSAGNVYVATVGGVRKIALDNMISTVTTPSLAIPAGLAIDKQNNLYVSDAFSQVVIRLGTDGSSTIIAGSKTAGFGGDGGAATSASLNNPAGLEVNSLGAVLVADRDNLRVRRIEIDGTIRTVAGNGNYRFSGDGQKAISASLRQPVSVATDSFGDLFIADLANNRVRKVTTDGIINTVAGNGTSGFSGDGEQAIGAALASPQGLAVDTSGFYIADRVNNRVRKVDVQGIINTIAGGGVSGFTGLGDGGPATKAVLRFPFALALDGRGNLYIADAFNDRIRKVSPDGNISTVAGGGTSTADGVLATNFSLNAPQGVAVDAQNRLYISDTDSNRIRVVQTNGTLTTIAGGGTATGDNVPASTARVDSPRGITVDAGGTVYFAEFNSNRVRRISAAIVSTVAGTGGPGGFSGDGGLAINAKLNGPTGVALDGTGNLYIADSNNSRIRKIFATPPTVQVTPKSLAFSEVAGGLLSAPRSINIFSDDLSGLPFSASILNNSPWLRVFPSAGPVPASLVVQADPNNLKPNVYTDTIRITTPNAAPRFTDVAVQFTVADPGQPLQVVQPDSFSFAFVRGSTPKSQTLTVANKGGGSITFSVRADNQGLVTFLSVSPTSGTASTSNPATITVTADPGSLPEGTYTGTVTVTLSNGPPVSIPVTVTISAVPQTIRLSQTGLTFTAVAGGGVVPLQTFSVLNGGLGVMKWTATVVARPGAALFLSLSPAVGSSDAASLSIPSVTVKADATNFAPGEYFNQIKVESATALNSPQFIPVVLEVLRQDQDPGPAVQPSELVFSGIAGTPPPGSQDLFVYNLKGAPLNYRSQKTTVNGIDWIQYLPTEAAVGSQQPKRIVVQPDTTLLGRGVQQGVLTLRFDDGNTRKINILAVVLAPVGSASTNSKSALRAAQAACTPKDLVPSLPVLGQDFVVPAGYPTSLVVNVVDDCNNALTEGRVQVSFSNGDPMLSLMSLHDGRWSNTWLPSRTTGTLKLTVTTESPALGLRKTLELSGGTRSTAATPRINSGGIVNTADFGRKPLSPGGMIAIFGTDLANGQLAAPKVPLDTTLAGTTVFIAGQDLPLIYASPNQVNAILPYNLNPNTDYQLLIANGDRISDAQPIIIAATQPVIFQTQLGPAIVDTKGTLIGHDNPAHAGDVLLIFATGLGAVNGTVIPGASPGALPTISPATVDIGHTRATVQYAGLSPNFPGLYQVNVQVPPGLAPGDGVPLVLNIMGQSSPEVTVSVK